MKKDSFLLKEVIRYGLILVALAAGIFFSVQNNQERKEYAIYNHARMLAADQLNQVKECFLEGSFLSLSQNKGRYPLVITDVNGVVLYSDRKEYRQGDTVLLNELLQIDESFFKSQPGSVKTVFAIDNSGQTAGFAVFFIPREEAVGMTETQITMRVFMPILLAVLLVLFLLLLQIRYLKHRVIKPVEEMIVSSKAIIDGDYSVSVVSKGKRKIMQNDIEKLSYNFELMRDELREKREREEVLKRTQKELISCISHDLKTPITTIQAYGEGLRDGLAKEPEKVAKYAEIIVRKTEILSKMIRDLLVQTNAELNQLSVIKKEQYFNDFINPLAKELQGLVSHEGMEFSYQNTAPNLLVSFDENRMTQVLANLIDNSIKYGKKESAKIGITVLYHDAKKQMEITVWDNGEGIRAMDIPFVFHKFYRGEKSRNISIPGSGLGLSICKYIVEEHGGEISCSSKRNEGTSFVVTLPVWV